MATVFLWISAAYVIVLGVIGFLFGQLFWGRFEVGATFAGVFGMIAAWLAATDNKLSSKKKRVVVSCCAIGIIGLFVDAYNYYTKYDIPGSYYAWFLIGPYWMALLCIAYVASRHQ